MNIKIKDKIMINLKTTINKFTTGKLNTIEVIKRVREETNHNIKTIYACIHNMIDDGELFNMNDKLYTLEVIKQKTIRLIDYQTMTKASLYLIVFHMLGIDEKLVKGLIDEMINDEELITIDYSSTIYKVNDER